MHEGEGSGQGIDASSFRMYVINGVMPPSSKARDSDDAAKWKCSITIKR